MFLVVEFDKVSGCGLAIIREEWMTPRKKECFWPPFKQSTMFNKCLVNKNQQPIDDQWQLYPVVKIYYSTESILKARQKLREAGSEPEVLTEVDDSEKQNQRKRKLSKRLIFSDDSSEEDCNEPSVKIRYLPKPPQTNPGCSKVPAFESRCKEPKNETTAVNHTTNDDLLNESTDFEIRSAINLKTPIIDRTSQEVIAVAHILSRIEKRMDDFNTEQKKSFLCFPYCNMEVTH